MLTLVTAAAIVAVLVSMLVRAHTGSQVILSFVAWGVVLVGFFAQRKTIGEAHLTESRIAAEARADNRLEVVRRVVVDSGSGLPHGTVDEENPLAMPHVPTDRHAWERAGAHEEAPGVFRIPLPLPGDHLKAVNVYAVVDGQRVVMVDGGMALPESEVLLRRGLRQIGFDLRDVSDFLVTHMHRDHYTQAVAVRRTLGTRVSLGEGERLALETLQSLSEGPDIPSLVEAGAADLAAGLAEWRGGGGQLADYETPDRWLSDGTELPLPSRRLRVIATPGHTRGHVVFHDVDAGVLFAGDHVLPHITPSIGVEVPRARPPETPLRAYLTSLRLVKAMPDAIVLPAHGPAGGSAHARADELLTHHEQRLSEAAATLDRGASTGFESARLLTWTRRHRALDDLDLFNQILAIHETVAHLEILVDRGEVRRVRRDAVLHYERSRCA